MKLFVFLVFAGCAVKCDEANNYYVIERPSDPPLRDLKTFQVYWNVPTKQCRSRKVPFDSLFERYGIVQNKGDNFLGEQVVILYDPGLFPAILKDDTSGKLKFRNGGVPQEGNLDEHLTAFRFSLDQAIPDPEFNGVAIIDFESWRPVFRQNFGELTPYKNVSYLNERRLHPWWTRGMIEAEAKYRFERSGREFMQATASLARLLRPRARWGYYAFPYCFNMAPSNQLEGCTENIQRENDQISWLWSESNALYPSLYSSKSLSTAQLVAMIRGRVAESARVGRGLPILPYFWFRYRDAGYMSETDLRAALKTMYKSQATGFVIWGSSNDVNTLEKCENLKKYLETVLGPSIALYTKQKLKYDEADTKETNINDTKVILTTENSLDLLVSETKDNPNIDEESIKDLISSDSNHNYTKNSPEKLSDEIVTSLNNDDKYKEQNNSILIDILLSIIENVQKSENKDEMAKEMVKINKDRKKGTPLHDTFTKVSTENYLELSTKNPFEKQKKKGDMFTFLFTGDTTTDLNNITTTNDVTSTPGTLTTNDVTSTLVTLTTNDDNSTTETVITNDFNATAATLTTNDVNSTLAALTTLDFNATTETLTTNDIASTLAKLTTNDVTLTPAILTTDDVNSTTAALTTNDATTPSQTLTTNVVTTNSDISITEVWDDNNTFYNEDTFLDQEFNFNTPDLTTSDITTEAHEETQKKEYSLVDYTTETNKATSNSDDREHKNEFSIADFTNEMNEVSLDSKDFTETTAVNVLTTADGTTTEIIMEEKNDTLSVDPANIQLVISFV